MRHFRPKDIDGRGARVLFCSSRVVALDLANSISWSLDCLPELPMFGFLGGSFFSGPEWCLNEWDNGVNLAQVSLVFFCPDWATKIFNVEKNDLSPSMTYHSRRRLVKPDKSKFQQRLWHQLANQKSSKADPRRIETCRDLFCEVWYKTEIPNFNCCENWYSHLWRIWSHIMIMSWSIHFMWDRYILIRMGLHRLFSRRLQSCSFVPFEYTYHARRDILGIDFDKIEYVLLSCQPTPTPQTPWVPNGQKVVETPWSCRFGQDSSPQRLPTWTKICSPNFRVTTRSPTPISFGGRSCQSMHVINHNHNHVIKLLNHAFALWSYLSREDG